jgi:hypothetical protein
MVFFYFRTLKRKQARGDYVFLNVNSYDALLALCKRAECENKLRKEMLTASRGDEVGTI